MECYKPTGGLQLYWVNGQGEETRVGEYDVESTDITDFMKLMERFMKHSELPKSVEEAKKFSDKLEKEIKSSGIFDNYSEKYSSSSSSSSVSFEKMSDKEKKLYNINVLEEAEIGDTILMWNHSKSTGDWNIDKVRVEPSSTIIEGINGKTVERIND